MFGRVFYTAAINAAFLSRHAQFDRRCVELLARMDTVLFFLRIAAGSGFAHGVTEPRLQLTHREG